MPCPLHVSSTSLPPTISFSHTTLPTHEVLTLATSAPAYFGAGAGVGSPRAYVVLPHSSTSHFLAFQCSEFCRPVTAGSNLDFDWFDRPGFVRPHVVAPLIIFDGDEVVLVGPVDAFHDVVIAVVGKEIRWGISGDVTKMEEGWVGTAVIVRGKSVRAVMEVWGGIVGKGKRGCYDGRIMAEVSYWTDNGSAYWYRTEGGLGVSGTLRAVMEDLGVAIGCVELDSWFYPHKTSRKFTGVENPDVVPPTGMLAWEPREEIEEAGGVTGLRESVGGRELVLHARHISCDSPYIEAEGDWWVDGERAHPKDGGGWLWRRWMESAADWGATAFEQDWLVECWLGVRQLREVPGRILQWQKALDNAARDAGIATIWCMATPADMCVATELSSVVAVRSSDDYRYADDPGILWRWHLTVSALVRSLGLWPFKDVFLSHPESGSDAEVDIDGDVNAELEAALSALSAGPVAIGDRQGRTCKRIVRRTCRVDGVIIKPDAPLAAMDRSLVVAAHASSPLVWADTTCGGGRWRCVLVVHAGRFAEAKADEAAVQEDGSAVVDDVYGDSGSHTKDASALVYDWRTGEAQVTDRLTVALNTHEWKLFIVCPLKEVDCDRMIIIGDVNAYATMGQRRMRARERGGELVVEVTGKPGEECNIAAWSKALGLRVRPITIPSQAFVELDLIESAWTHATQGVPEIR